MPELPEVETTMRGLLPHLRDRRIRSLVVRTPALRWPIPTGLAARVRGLAIGGVMRRGKYLLVACTGDAVPERPPQTGFLLIHLGMTGTLRAHAPAPAPGKHDHVDIVLDNGTAIRFNDPRRFGALLWIEGENPVHPLLDSLGVEPLSRDFDGDYLYSVSRGRSVAIKQFLMDSHVVTGVGNIYANEALFHAGIHPQRMAGKVSLSRYDRLVSAVRMTLRSAIKAGGSSIRDFVGSDGGLGYFQLDYRVYGRAGEPCKVCGSVLRTVRQGQRATFYCPKCQR